MQAFRYKEMNTLIIDVGHMTKMSAMSIYGLKIFFPSTSVQILSKLGPLVDLDLYHSMVKLWNLGFYMGKCDNDGFFGN